MKAKSCFFYADRCHPLHTLFSIENSYLFWEIFISSRLGYIGISVDPFLFFFFFTFIFDEKDVRLVRASGLMKRKESGR